MCRCTAAEADVKTLRNIAEDVASLRLCPTLVPRGVLRVDVLVGLGVGRRGFHCLGVQESQES